MNNIEVLRLLDDCETELKDIEQSIRELGYANIIVLYLTRYAVIRACGTIERAFKLIIADYCSQDVSPQVKNYLTKKVRDSPSTPYYRNINSLLGDFDNNWRKKFKEQVNSHPNKDILLDSMESLVSVRNSFAHGNNNSTTTISNTLTYYTNFRIVMDILDDVVYTKIDN